MGHKSKVELEISEWGRPIIWIADWYYQTLQGSAVPYITNQCVFATRHEAIRWCKFTLQLHGGIDWDTWVSSQADYPYMKNSDKEGLTPTFIATLEGECRRADNGEMGTWMQRVSVHRTEVCGEFNWCAKTADGKWNRLPEAINSLNLSDGSNITDSVHRSCLR
jgi:hypothetical protein